jgi:hypothetical protein
MAAANMDPEKYSGHSFRKGGAQSAYDAGIPIADIKILGRWRSWCFELYRSITVSKHAEYAQAMAQAPYSEALGCALGILGIP